MSHKVTRAERSRAEKNARKLLQSPRFFNKFLRAIKRAGLVGEEQNALVLLIVVVSRILPRPLNAFVKGHSSGGQELARDANSQSDAGECRRRNHECI